jgi:hypothetical protein
VLENGSDIRTDQGPLGHNNIQTTAQKRREAWRLTAKGYRAVCGAALRPSSAPG